MNSSILNREFKLPDDGWYQIAQLGEFVHAGAGVVQIVDAAACALMVQRFKVDTKLPNFAGLLVDFDHFSLDQRNKSEAAGWITGMESRDGGHGHSTVPRAGCCQMCRGATPPQMHLQ